MNGNDEQKITAIMILEVLGRPKEHLIQTLKEFIEQINSEKGVEVKENKISEPKLLKNQKDLFSSFVEMEVEIRELTHLSGLVFKYMPSHVEVVEPEKIILTNNQAGDVLNEITRRLHKYEELAKVLDYQNKALEKKLQNFEKK